MMQITSAPSTSSTALTSAAGTKRRLALRDDAGSQPPQAPAPSAGDPSEGGHDGAGAIDFSTIDSAPKAALLPALNGASLAVMMATLQAEARWNVAVTSLQQTTLNNAMGAEVRCEGTSSTSSEVSLTGSGNLGEVPIEETWTLHKDNGVLTVDGTIGYSHEALVLHDAGDGSQVLEGTIGEVAVHEVLRRSEGSMSLDGTLNDVEHHQVLTINENTMPLRAPQVYSKVITVDGSLGDAPITLCVDAICPEHVSAVTYAQHGTIAGTAVDTQHTLAIMALPGTTRQAP
jgi:hypothetical protein